MLKTYISIFLLLITAPMSLLSASIENDDRIDDFMTDILNANNDDERNVLFDSLYYSLKRTGYEGSASSLSWEIFKTANQSNDSCLISNSLSTLLHWHMSNSKYEILIDYSDSILNNNYQINLIDSINIYNLRANSYFRLRVYKKCLQYIMYRDELLSFTDNEFKKEYYANVPIMASNLYFSTGLYHESIEETKKLITEILKYDSSATIETHYNNIGVAWQKLGQPDSAMNYFNMARSMILLNNNRKNDFFFHLVEGNIGSVLMMKKEYDSAVAMLLRDLKSSKKLKTEEGYYNVISTQLSLAKYFFNSGNFSQTISLLDSTLVYANLSQHKTLPIDYYQLKAEIFNYLNLQDSAYIYAKKYFTRLDSIWYKEKQESVVSLQIAFDTKKKEHIISNQKKQLLNEKIKTERDKRSAQKQKYILYTSLLGFAIVLISLILIIRSRKKQKIINRVLEEKNRKISTQAENLKKLDKFKEEMTSMLAHDLKNPLNTITSLAEESGESEQKQVKQAAIKMLNMVLNLLDISKYESSKMPLTIKEWQGKTIVDNAIQRVQLLADKKYLIIHNYVDDSVRVMVDIEILERIFENLFTNAIKYSPVNGKIIISTEVISDDEVRFIVSDEGGSILEGHKEKLFDKYYQAEAKTTGEIRSTGLGLAFCKMAIEAHEGMIAIDSQPGKLTKFWFTVKKGVEIPGTEVHVKFKQENNVKLNLTQSEKKELQFINKELRHTEYYEFSKIRRIINSLDDNKSENITIWRGQLLSAVKSGNEVLYKILINF